MDGSFPPAALIQSHALRAGAALRLLRMTTFIVFAESLGAFPRTLRVNNCSHSNKQSYI